MSFSRYGLVVGCLGLALAHVSGCGGTSSALFSNNGGTATSGTAGITGGARATGGSSSGVGGSGAGAFDSGGTSSSGGTGIGTGGAEETGGANAGGSDRGGSGGLAGSSGSAGDSGAAGSGGTAPQCTIEASETPPYETKFKFSNQSDKRLFLHQACSLEYTVTSCVDGYQKPLSLTTNCTTECSKVDIGCIACGACPEFAKTVAEGKEVEDDWQGLIYEFEVVDNCQCHKTANAPAATYRIVVPVYETEDQVKKRQPAWTVTKEFTLPAPSGEVIVPLQKPE